MNLDGLTLHKIIENIKTQIIGKRLNNIYNPLKAEYDFHIRDKVLLVSISPNNGRIYFTDFIKENPSMPSNFAMVLRKYVRKAIILNVETIGYERIVKFDFKGRGELGEERTISLYAELMGKYSNLILVDGDRIIDSHRRIVTRLRKVLPNKTYIPFTSDKKIPEHYLEKEHFFEDFRNSDNFEKSLISKIQGFSPKIAKIIASKCETVESLYSSYFNYINEYIKNKGLYFSDKKVSPIPVNDLEYNEDLNKKLENIYINIEKEEISHNKKHKYFLKLQDEIKKLTKAIENLQSDLKETENYEIYRKYGELLQIYQGMIKSRNPLLEDYETGKKLQVPLIQRKNALESSLIYFKKYNKLKRRKKILNKRIDDLKKRLNQANDILLHIDIASDDNDIKDIELELRDFGITFKTKKKSKHPQKKVLKSKPKKYLINGTTLFVGKNSFQNEQLYRNSPKDSTWIHAKGIPSSHGILIGNYNDDILKIAAEIIAHHSKAKLSSKVQIDYTSLSNVWKPKGAAKGFVLYKNFKTIVVDPDGHTELIEK
jgi:predicted ribosome quality control (RQC) complex YloA/Tae2 family protein